MQKAKALTLGLMLAAAAALLPQNASARPWGLPGGTAAGTMAAAGDGVRPRSELDWPSER